MTILYGPVCKDKYIWWVIGTTNAETLDEKKIDEAVVGWTVEWDSTAKNEKDKGYYLEQA